MRSNCRDGRKGSAIIEFSLLAPWMLFLFAGVLDFGFYAYALIATQNAARVAALYASSSVAAASNTDGACQYALAELHMMPNVGSSVTSCAASPGAISDAQPVAVTATALVRGGADNFDAAQVTVAYKTVPVIPLPFMAGRMTIAKTVQIRIAED